MAPRQTEALHQDADGLDTKPSDFVLAVLAKGQVAAAEAVVAAIPAIASAADIVAATLSRNGRLVYAAAGSSGLMALADALELPGTYGIPLDRIVVLIAGGRQALIDLAGAPEDDGAAVAAELAQIALGADDCLIAVSASGTTPYAVSALEAARGRGTATIGIANNPGTPLVTRADVGVVLETPPEVIAGSTRMGAGTAQKIALNMISTLAAIKLGHVHDGHMVSLKADNAKLQQRAIRMVAAIADCPEAVASASLLASGWAVKPAVLLARGAARDAEAASSLLAAKGQRLRAALSAGLEGSHGSRHNGT